MGYRHYFVTAPKVEIDELRLKSMEDFRNEFEKVKKEYYDFDDYLDNRLSPFFSEAEEVIELGKLHRLKNGQDIENRLLAKSKKIEFKDEQIEHRLTDENCLAICNIKTLEEYIHCLSDLWLDYLENDLKNEVYLRIYNYKIRRDLKIFVEDTFMTRAQEVKDIIKYNVIDFKNNYLMLIAW